MFGCKQVSLHVLKPASNKLSGLGFLLIDSSLQNHSVVFVTVSTLLLPSWWYASVLVTKRYNQTLMDEGDAARDDLADKEHARPARYSTSRDQLRRVRFRSYNPRDDALRQCTKFTTLLLFCLSATNIAPILSLEEIRKSARPVL